MLQRTFLWMQNHERHLSAVAMFAGFIADNLLFKRIDLWQTQAVFAGYTAVCLVGIPLLHALETRGAYGLISSRLRLLLPFAIQFALGGFWSGFVIFYGRSADLGASWPFILFLLLVLLGSEYFHQYHSRLVFTSVLFFFALYSYAIFAVPVYTGTIGVLTFLGSSVLAAAIFALFTVLLRTVARERFLEDLWRIRVGAVLVFVVMTVSYFTNILPPLPLSAEAAGVYSSVWRVPGAYIAAREAQSWQVRYLGFAPILHVVSGGPVSAYSSVFAPTTLATSIVHRWERYDRAKKAWVLKSKIVYPIVGGRDGGYRGYSTVPISEAGEWRVAVETSDGRLIVRLPFTVEIAAAALPQETIILK